MIDFIYNFEADSKCQAIATSPVLNARVSLSIPWTVVWERLLKNSKLLGGHDFNRWWMHLVHTCREILWTEDSFWNLHTTHGWKRVGMLCTYKVACEAARFDILSATYGQEQISKGCHHASTLDPFLFKFRPKWEPFPGMACAPCGMQWASILPIDLRST